jgi:hypothetical protein
MEAVRESIKLEGFSRVQIEQDGEIRGDSGWVGPNQIGDAGSKFVQYVALGTGTAPGAAAVTLDGEIMGSTQRKSVTFASNGSTTAEFTATFASSDNFLTVAADLSNIGLFFTTTTNDTLMAGNTYTSSSCDTNQNVNVTYQIRFS